MSSAQHQISPPILITQNLTSIPLDTICREYSFKNILLKIDVEGAEFDVLTGGINFIKTHKPEIILATHDCHVPGIESKCLRLLQQLNYTYKSIDDNKFIKGQADYLCKSNEDC
ncbi:MAG: FkbM family methyltransferase [Crocinitomicaceae bacterium]|nr:FkbM family methyltransferase [Crocinitomicaceae bacterium]